MARVVVDVVLKPEILDPQGQAIVGGRLEVGIGQLDRHRHEERVGAIPGEPLHQIFPGAFRGRGGRRGR